MEKETSPQTEATTTASAAPTQEQASKPVRKRRFVEIFQKHRLDITKVAEKAKVPEYVVYYLLLNLPVNRHDAQDIIEAVDHLADADYRLSDLDYVVSTLDEQERAYVHRHLSTMPFHRITLDGKCIYHGFDWREANQQFFEALERSGGKRVVSHIVEAPRVAATCAAARANALPKREQKPGDKHKDGA